MMELRIRRRWVRWWIEAIAGGLIVVFGWAIYHAFRMPNSGGQLIHIFIPVYAVAAYLGLALAFNRRTVTVTPDKVTLVIGPLRVGLSQTIPRSEIALCYHRHVQIRSQKYGDEIYHTAGIETVRGYQLDTSGRLETKEEAWRAAQEVAQVLQVEVQTRPVGPAPPLHKVLVLMWWAILTLATLAGGVWEAYSPS